MITVYVLRSQKNGRRYVGSTSKSLKDRLDWHRQGASPWTRNNGPFELVHSEELSDKSAALKREKYLKTGQGRRTLDILLACQTQVSEAPPKSAAGRH